MTNEDLQVKINEIKAEKNPLRQAYLVSELRTLNLVSNIKLAEMLGVKPSHLSHLVRILKLPEIVLDGYAAKHLSLTHLIIMSRVTDTDQLIALYEEILSKSLTIAQTEHRVREILYQVDAQGEYVSSDTLRMYEERLTSALGAGKVKIVQTRIQCRVVIEMTGNLATTTQYLIDLGARFRRKRSKFDESTPKVDASHSDPSLVQDNVSSNQTVSHHENSVEVPQIHHHTPIHMPSSFPKGFIQSPPRYEKHTLELIDNTHTDEEVESADRVDMGDEVKSTQDDEPLR
ncbi:MAG: hypothetical protein WCO78_00210 [Candidatus Roizmanbacteria bacterium]